MVLAAYSVLGVTVLNRVHPAASTHHAVRDAVIDFGAAALLALLALRSIVRRPTSAEQHERRTASHLDDASPVFFLGVGAVGMLANFSTLVLYLPALHEIARSTVSTAGRALVFVVLYVITLLPVLVPVASVTVLGHRADPALDLAHRFVGRNMRRIGITVEIVFAAYLTWKGIRTLP